MKWSTSTRKSLISGNRTRAPQMLDSGRVQEFAMNTLWDASLTRTPDLVQRNFWFRLKLHRVRHSGLLPPLAILDPRLRQVQTECYRHTRLFRGYRKADSYPAVILFAHLAAILSSHSY